MTAKIIGKIKIQDLYFEVLELKNGYYYQFDNNYPISPLNENDLKEVELYPEKHQTIIAIDPNLVIEETKDLSILLPLKTP